MAYRLAKDIVIPAGTLLHTAPAQTTRSDIDGRPALTSGKPPHFVEATLAATKDTIFTWTMHAGDARDAGLIEEMN